MNENACNSCSACDHCEEATASEYLADPFLLEVYDEESYSYWCRDCYYARLVEI